MMRRLSALPFFAFAIALPCVMATAVLASPSAARADTVSPEASAEARVAFETGQKLFDAGKLQEAQEQFIKAYAISKSPNARLMKARCLLGLGRLTEAYDEMLATSREATVRAETDPRYVPTRDAAASELAVLQGRLGRITVVILDFPVGTSVTVNGERLPAERIGFPIPVKPGKVLVRVVPPPGSTTPPLDRELTLGAGDVQTVAVSQPKPIAEVPIERPEPKVGLLRGAGIGVAAVGVVGMAVFAGAGVASNGKFHSLQQSCGSMRCTNPADASTVDSGKTLDTVANVGLGVGIVGIVGGVAMIVFGGPKKAAAATTGLQTFPIEATARGVSFSF